MEKFKTQTSFSETKFLCFLTNCASPTPTPNASTHTFKFKLRKRNDANLQFFWRGGGGGELREKKNFYINLLTDFLPSFPILNYHGERDWNRKRKTFHLQLIFFYYFFFFEFTYSTSVYFIFIFTIQN